MYIPENEFNLTKISSEEVTFDFLIILKAMEFWL